MRPAALALSLTILVQASGAFATEAEGTNPGSAAGAEQPGLDEQESLPANAVEVTEMRTITSRTFLNPDGTFTSEYFGSPIHFRDSDGHLLPIDAVAIRSHAPGMAFETRAGGVITQLADSSVGSDIVTVAVAGHRISYRPTTPLPRVGEPLAAAREPTSDGSAVTYADVYPDVDLRYSILPNGVKEDIILNEPGDVHRFAFLLKSPGLVATLEEDGSVVVGTENDTVFRLPAPYMVDSSDEADGDGARSTDVRYSVRSLGANTLLVVEADPDWLTDPARVYPVYIDPTVLAEPHYATADTFISSAYPSLPLDNQWNPSEGGYYELWNGYYDATSGTNYAYVRTSVPSNATVLSATFDVFVQHAYSAGTPTSIQLGRLTSAFTEAQTWNMAQPTWLALTSDTVADNQWASFDVKSTVEAWVYGTAVNHGFRIYESSNSVSLWKRLRSSENALAPPRLTVTYSRPEAWPGTPTSLAWRANANLTWNYDSGGSGLAQNKWQVQLSTSSTQWTPNFLIADSGWQGQVTNTWIAPTANLVSGGTYYWRVKAYDGHAWSDWSGPASFRYDAALPAFASSAVGGAITAAAPNYYDLGNGTFTIAIRGSDAHSGIKRINLRLSNATDELRVQHDWSVGQTHCYEYNPSTLVDSVSCQQTYISGSTREVTFTVTGLNSTTNFDVQYHMTDYAGNVLNYSDTGTNVYFDGTPPAGSFTNPGAGATVSGTVDITGTASDANFSQYELHYGSGANPTTWLSIGTNPRTTPRTNASLGTWNTAGLSTGTYTIRLRVYDYARVTSGYTQVLRTVTVDNDAPTAAITAPPNGGFVAGTATITGTANASSGFLHYTLHYGAGCSPSSWTDIGANPRVTPVTNGTLGTWATGTLEGSHAIRLVVTRTDGQTNTAVVCVTVDNTSPSAVIGSPGVGEFVNGSVEIIGQAIDTNFTEYELHYGAGTAPTHWLQIPTNPRTAPVTDGTLGTWDTSGLTTGAYSIRLRVFDPTHQSSGFAEAIRTVTVSDAVNLLTPELLHANGAALRWTIYDGSASFGGYEIHRSETSAFVPSTETLIVTLGERARSSYRDTTARPNAAFSYVVVVNGLLSNEQRVTLPSAGQASMTLQPTPSEGRVARIDDLGSGCANRGTERTSQLGTSTTGVRRALFAFDLRQIPHDATVSAATFSYYFEPTTAAVGSVSVHRVTAAWEEGAGVGACDGSGASWLDAEGVVPWDAPGGDYDPSSAATVNPTSRSVAGWDAFAIEDLVQSWVTGTAPNHGLLVRLASEQLVAGNYIVLRTDDHGLYPATRPTLTVLYSEPADVLPPIVNLTTPVPGSTVRGTVPVTATASDDGGITSVDFLVDGASIGTDGSSPFGLDWDTTYSAAGSHSVTVAATDNAGNVVTSSPAAVIVDNSAPPAVSLLSPIGGDVSGLVPLAASANDDGGVSRVDFLVNGNLLGSDAEAPYTLDWNTLDSLLTAYDGDHTLAARAYDAGGQATTSAEVIVSVANRTGLYFAELTSSAIPSAMFEDEVAGGRTESQPVLDRNLGSAPRDSTPTGAVATGTECTTDPTNQTASAGHPVDVTVTNSGAAGWLTDTLQLWYRWHTADGSVLFEGPASEGHLDALGAAEAATLAATVFPPALCGSEQLAEYRLRFDLYEPLTDTWFAELGNEPIDVPVIVGEELQSAVSDRLGLERYYQYWGTDTGAGMGHLANLATGNSLLHWSPFSSPGRGLSTVIDLTYNSLEDASQSPVGNNWSLAISSLTRFGSPLEVHPTPADDVAGLTDLWIMFTDGDGTTHRFDGHQAADGTTYWSEPPGVHLYLRQYSDTDPTREWALTRPDGVTFFYNSDGHPTAAGDRNGNELHFTLEEVPVGEDPGGPAWRISAVTDAAGVADGTPNRSFDLAYFTADDAATPAARGNIRRITDHTGSAIDFEYYADGNLLRITQRGGSNADGSVLQDRAFVLTYTTPDGTAPAIPAEAARANPPPLTIQSTRLYSIRDPRGEETTFSYYGPTTEELRWRLASVADRAGESTSFTYDLENRVTTVTAPLDRLTSYAYDSNGKVTEITDPLGQLTSIEWSADFHVVSLDEPGNSVQEFAYNANGYLTDQWVRTAVDGSGNPTFTHTQLAYEDLPADANDTSGKWAAGRTIPHISQLASKTDPNGTMTPTAGDYEWLFDYDANGNLTQLVDPEDYSSTFSYNSDGTLATATDANGNVTEYASYDANGLPEVIHEGLEAPGSVPLRSTRLDYDDDGLLIALQDPNHFNLAASMSANDASRFEYDSFHRLGRQSAPKSTQLELGTLIWSAAFYDANGNVVRQVGPHFGSGYSGSGATTTIAYDTMDRQTLVTGPDASVDPEGERTFFTYDAAGRLASVTAPLGVATESPNDHAVFYAYDALDRVVRQTRHETDSAQAIISSLHTHACYDASGDLVGVTSPRADATGVDCGDPNLPYTTRFEYDHAHRQTVTTDPLGNQMQSAYDSSGNVIGRTDANGSQTTVAFDQRGMPVRVEEPFATDAGPRTLVTLIEYDAVGNRTRIISPRAYDAAGGGPPFNQYVTSFTHDALNRVARISLPTSNEFPQGQYVHQAYDANGNVVWSTLPTLSGNSPPTSETTAGTLTAFWDPGWVASVRTPDTSPRTHVDYTAEGWQASRAPELPTGELNPGEELLWSYFADGMLTERRDRGGQGTTYEYDANNRLTEALDTAGVTAAQRAPVELLASYDTLDRLARVRQGETNSNTRRFTSYAYDLAGNVTERIDNGVEPVGGGAPTDPGRRQVYSYDQADWLTTQLDYGIADTNTDDQRITNTFFPTGWEQERVIERYDGTNWVTNQTTSWTYFPNGKLDTLVTRNGANAVMESHEVEYLDAGVYVNGNRTSDEFQLDGPDAAAPCRTTLCTATYEYDPRERVVSTADGHGSTTNYILDVAGNIAEEAITSSSGTETTSYAYVGNQLQAVTTATGTQNHWYDPRGNLDCVTIENGSAEDCELATAGTVSNQLLAHYQYDYLDRLASYRSFTITGSTSAADDTTDYDYDALDRVVEQTESHDGQTANPRTTLLTHLGLTTQVSLEEQEDEGGNLLTTKQYSYDAFGHRISLTDDPTDAGAPGSGDPTADTYTYGYDVHGSVSLLIDQTGNATASYGYRPYGAADPDLTAGDFDPADPDAEPERQDNPLNAFRYTGRRYDSGSGSIDMGARRFGPDTARFLQRDYLNGALGDLGLSLDPLTQNRYSLAGGNPVTFVEWDGHLNQVDGGGGGSPTPTPSSGAASRDSCETGLRCTLDDIASRPPEGRLDLIERIPEQYPRLQFDPAWFNAIKEYIRFSAGQGLLNDRRSWSSYVDAGIIQSILDGAALAAGRTATGSPDNGSGLWEQWFTEARQGASDDRLRQLWGSAEQAGTRYGVVEAFGRRAVPNLAEMLTGIGAGNLYRSAVSEPAATRLGGAVAGGALGAPAGPLGIAMGGSTGWATANWLFDPRSEGPAEWGPNVIYGFYSWQLAPIELVWPDGPAP